MRNGVQVEVALWFVQINLVQVSFANAPVARDFAMAAWKLHIHLSTVNYLKNGTKFAKTKETKKQNLMQLG